MRLHIISSLPLHDKKWSESNSISILYNSTYIGIYKFVLFKYNGVIICQWKIGGRTTVIGCEQRMQTGH